MKSGNPEYLSDKKFVIKLLTDMISNSEDLFACLEEQSIYWNDDLEYVLVMVEKTLKKFKAGSDEKIGLMPLFKNEEDEDFVRKLFRKAVLHTKKCLNLLIATQLTGR